MELEPSRMYSCLGGEHSACPPVRPGPPGQEPQARSGQGQFEKQTVEWSSLLLFLRNSLTEILVAFAPGGRGVGEQKGRGGGGEGSITL